MRSYATLAFTSPSPVAFHEYTIGSAPDIPVTVALPFVNTAGPFSVAAYLIPAIVFPCALVTDTVTRPVRVPSAYVRVTVAFAGALDPASSHICSTLRRSVGLSRMTDTRRDFHVSGFRSSRSWASTAIAACSTAVPSR